MHEMALMRPVVDTVLKFAEDNGATEVKTVYMTVGYNRDVVEAYMTDMFAWLARGTMAENAELIIYRTPSTVKCNHCGKIFHLNIRDESTWVCPHCHTARDYKLNTGMEFRINRIDVTLPSDCQSCASASCDSCNAAINNTLNSAEQAIAAAV